MCHSQTLALGRLWLQPLALAGISPTRPLTINSQRLLVGLVLIVEQVNLGASPLLHQEEARAHIQPRSHPPLPLTVVLLSPLQFQALADQIAPCRSAPALVWFGIAKVI